MIKYWENVALKKFRWRSTTVTVPVFLARATVGEPFDWNVHRWRRYQFLESRLFGETSEWILQSYYAMLQFLAQAAGGIELRTRTFSISYYFLHLGIHQ